MLRVYSAAEHRKDALDKAEQLWGRMVEHLGDRLEGPDRAPEQAPEAVARQAEETGRAWARRRLTATAQKLGKERERPAG